MNGSKKLVRVCKDRSVRVLHFEPLTLAQCVLVAANDRRRHVDDRVRDRRLNVLTELLSMWFDLALVKNSSVSCSKVAQVTSVFLWLEFIIAIVFTSPGLHSDLSLTSLEGDEGETLRRGALTAACADAAAAFAALEGSRVRDSIAAHARRALERERQIDEKNEIIADLSSKVSQFCYYSVIRSMVYLGLKDIRIDAIDISANFGNIFFGRPELRLVQRNHIID
ncbi:hypothetical protein EVAR_66138_1 [Eumeta japonica]|uniref:Uncharacterized protein n=1 Tax=Eumeta variegata TaxID=151549 RepID=A0A4C1Z1W0_EUMVA|nr:hypothetical protein EVAR_66138_1 [Eumeta japonica]